MAQTINFDPNPSDPQDPGRRLIAKMAVKAVRDYQNPRSAVYNRETARQFLHSQEGQEILRILKISPQRIKATIGDPS